MDELPKKQTSKLAIVSLLCTIFPIVAVTAVMFAVNIFSMSVTQLAGWSIFLVSMLIFFAATIFAFIALRNINKSSGQLCGRPLAIISMVISIFIISSVVFLMLKFRETGCRLVCATNVKGLGTAFHVYANDFEGNLPTAESWCDLLVVDCDVSPKSFVCPEFRRKFKFLRKFKFGESSYAMNKHAAGKKLSELPGDMVLMFETDLGWEKGGRSSVLGDRAFYKIFSDTIHYQKHSPKQKMYENRWNQVGGFENMTTQYHSGKGCNILFCDGHAEFVKTEELPKLKWKVKYGKSFSK